MIDHEKQTGPHQNSVKEYSLGLITSLLLTLAGYYCVVDRLFQGAALQMVIGGLAILQGAIQLLLFLNLAHGTKPRWNIIVFFFTLMIIAIVVVGSIWIMNHLNYNMMGHT
jgi:cytochrome o ubiquinol oxidase operon protein cyoD